MIVVNTGSDIYQVFHRNKSINWVRNNLTSPPFLYKALTLLRVLKY